jgi:hypothetical protein
MRSSISELSVQSEDNPFTLASHIRFSFKEFLQCKKLWEQCFCHLRFSVYVIIVTSLIQHIYIYIYIYISFIVKTQHLLHCIVQYVIQLRFSAYFRPSSGCICLALGVLYYDDKIILFWWWDLDHFILCLIFMVGIYAVQYGWVRALGVRWRRWICCILFGIFFLFCSFSRGIFFLFCSIPGCLLRGWCVHGSLCRFAPLSENKKILCLR